MTKVLHEVKNIWKRASCLLQKLMDYHFYKAQHDLKTDFKEIYKQLGCKCILTLIFSFVYKTDNTNWVGLGNQE